MLLDAEFEGHFDCLRRTIIEFEQRSAKLQQLCLEASNKNSDFVAETVKSYILESETRTYKRLSLSQLYMQLDLLRIRLNHIETFAKESSYFQDWELETVITKDQIKLMVEAIKVFNDHASDVDIRINKDDS